MDVANDGSSEDRPWRIEVLTGPERRRHWSDEAKARIVAESVVPGAMVSQVARRHDVLPSQIYAWRKAARVSVRRGFQLPTIRSVPRGPNRSHA